MKKYLLIMVKKKMLDSLNITVYDSNILCQVSSDPINLSCLSVELDLQNEDELCLVCRNRSGNRMGMEVNHNTMYMREIKILVRVRFGFHTNEFFIPIPIKKKFKHIHEWE